MIRLLEIPVSQEKQTPGKRSRHTSGPEKG
jgi:hypothetical protein